MSSGFSFLATSGSADLEATDEGVSEQASGFSFLSSSATEPVEEAPESSVSGFSFLSSAGAVDAVSEPQPVSGEASSGFSFLNTSASAEDHSTQQVSLTFYVQQIVNNNCYTGTCRT
jgi:hypothetical protein